MPSKSTSKNKSQAKHAAQLAHKPAIIQEWQPRRSTNTDIAAAIATTSKVQDKKERGIEIPKTPPRTKIGAAAVAVKRTHPPSNSGNNNKAWGRLRKQDCP